jgi:hypothetical protein
MSSNKFLPHLFVLPEDDANRQIANGFFLALAEGRSQRQFYILEEAGGWNEAVERFCNVYAAEMDKVPARLMVLVIDLDHHLDRIQQVKNRIPEHLRDRVFVLGALDEPESLREDLGSYEKIGLAIARDCSEGTDSVWTHRHLRHNASEVARLRDQIRVFLFQ